MEPINLEPRYSTGEIPGRCLKCLAEDELNSCLISLLSEEGNNPIMEARYEALLSFLQSPDSISIRDKAEQLLSEGKKVSLVINNYIEGIPEFSLKIE